MPAEWEPQNGVILAWPVNLETWPDPSDLAQTQTSFLKLIDEIAQRETAYVICNERGESETVGEKLDQLGANLSSVKFLHLKHEDVWMRDCGPIFFERTESEQRSFYAHDFVFNTWGEKYGLWPDDDHVPERMGQMFQFPVIKHSMVLEGGSIEVNGSGCLLTTSQCLLNPNRNPQINQSEIEKRLSDYLGLNQIIWLGDGIEGDDTDGHIDDITRFVSEKRIVTVLPENSSNPDYAPLKANLDILEKVTFSDGSTPEISLLPTPKEKFEGPFGIAPASYANFLIINDAVLVPTFDDANDNKALEVLTDCFPSRQVIGVPCRSVVKGLGSIHCVTQQVPLNAMT